MKISKHRSISLLLIFALIFSTLAIVVPPATVEAAVTLITINSPTTLSRVPVKPGGIVPVNFTLNGTTSSSSSINFQVWSTSLGTVVNQSYTESENLTQTQNITIDHTAAEGLYNLSLSRADNTSITNTNTSSIYVDATPPSVGITAPNTSTCWMGGPQNIWWTATDAASTDNVTIWADLSVDGGSTYATYPILAGASYAQGGQSYPYSFPLTVNYSACMIRLKAIDRALNDSGWIYSPLFPILNVGPTVGVSSPAGSEVWNGGSLHNITGTIVASGANPTYWIKLSQNSGVNWTENITSTWMSSYLTQVSPGVYSLSYPWTLSSTVRSSTCRIQVLVHDCAGNTGTGASPADFRILDVVPPTCSVSIPTTGTTWNANTTQTISYSVVDNVPGNLNCTLLYSLDGTTYTSIASAPKSQGANTQAWTTPSSINSTTCYIKLVCTDLEVPANSTTIYSYAFSIISCTGVSSVTICSPNGGESWQAGSIHNITWTASDSQGSTTRMVYKIENFDGSNWFTIANLSNQAQCSSCTCSYSWAVADNVTGNALVRITATNACGSSAVSQSATPFTITTGGSCPLVTGSVALYTGWNLMSLPLIPTNTAINSILAPVMPSVISVWYYTGGTSGVWQSYAPGAPSSLTTLADGNAYWVNMSAPATLTFQGRKTICPPAVPSPQYSITSPGWWMVGFKSSISKAVQSYLPGGSTNCGVTYQVPIYGFNAPIQQYITPAPSCTDNMTTGSGYWVYFNSAATINGGVD